MDTQTGGWQYQYGVSAGNNTDLGRTINDLTTFRVFSDSVDNTDTDSDGIIDSDDSFPDDPDKAFEVFTPSKFGRGTIAFEDLWPSNGDYDFNDMALSYQAIAILNADNLAVQVDFICNVKSNFAGFTNGVGIEIEGLPSSQVLSITGASYNHDYISLNANGTEANQDDTVVILTDDASSLLNETMISVKFTQPINTNVLGVAPFNPFIIVNKDRAKEVHLPNRNTTSLGNNIFQVAGVNSDIDGNYISDSGFPWAISIIHDFKVPKESVAINEAYNFFNSWAISGGVDNQDWYKDNPGNRNNDKLEN
jgi:LruC domain-containing protein